MSHTTKTVVFNTDTEKDLLEHIKKHDSFSPYIKRLIREDMQSKNIMTEEYIVNLIKKYAPTVDEKDIRFDKDKVEALGQFDNL